MKIENLIMYITYLIIIVMGSIAVKDDCGGIIPLIIINLGLIILIGQKLINNMRS